MSQQENNLATINNEQAIAIPSTADMLFADGMMEKLERFAMLMAKGKSTLPAHFVNSPGDCMAVVMQAAQWKMNPFAVAQKTHLVSGTLGYEAQLVNAVITTMAPTRDRLHYEWFGDWSKVIGNFIEKTSQKNKKYIAPNWNLADEKGCGVKVWATMKGEEEPRVLELLLSQATVRNSTLWAADPKQQLAYLAVKRWSRLHCPDVIMGVYTPDELNEIPPEKDITPKTLDDLLPPETSQADKDGIEARVKEVIERINSSTSVQSIDALGREIATMDAGIQAKVRNQFIQKKRELEAETVNTETGEVTEGPAADKPAKVSEADLEAMVITAENIESLDKILAMLDGLPSKAARDRIAEKVSVRKMDFEG